MRGRRRHRRKLGGTPPRSPAGARAAEETAYPLALRLPRGSRWGRRSEGVLTRPKPQAARYPAGCPPLLRRSAARQRKHARTFGGGTGGELPPSLPSCDEGDTKLPFSARYLRAWAAQVSRGTRPSPPLSCGVARRWQRRALPTSEAGGRAVSGGAGGPAGAATPEELLLAGKNDARTQPSCGQRGLLAPRYPARGAGRCRGAVSAAILRRAPRSGRVEGNHSSVLGNVHRKPERSRAFPARYPAGVRGVGGFSFGRSPTKVPCPPPLSCGGGTGASEPPPFPGGYPAAVGAANEVGVCSFDLPVLICCLF